MNLLQAFKQVFHRFSYIFLRAVPRLRIKAATAFLVRFNRKLHDLASASGWFGYSIRIISYPTVPMAFCTKAIQWEAVQWDDSSKVRWKPMRMTLDLTPLLMGQQWSQLALDNGFKHFTSIAPVLKLSHVSQIVVLLQAAKSRSFWEAFSTACYRTSVVSLVTKVVW